MDRICPDQRIAGDLTIDSRTKIIRKKFAVDNADRELIQSVGGVRYKFETP